MVVWFEKYDIVYMVHMVFKILRERQGTIYGPPLTKVFLIYLPRELIIH